MLLRYGVVTVSALPVVACNNGICATERDQQAGLLFLVQQHTYAALWRKLHAHAHAHLSFGKPSLNSTPANTHHVHAAMADPRLGTMPQAMPFQRWLPDTSAYFHIRLMAVAHSATDET